MQDSNNSFQACSTPKKEANQNQSVNSSIILTPSSNVKKEPSTRSNNSSLSICQYENLMETRQTPIYYQHGYRSNDQKQRVLDQSHFDYLSDLYVQSSPELRRLSSKQKKKRKIRTTITRDRIKKMNQVFQSYYKQKEEGKSPGQTLKHIGNMLGLGYSTVLHKYRQYRSNNEVKGGALIVSLQKKRKYRKSLKVEDLIQKSLSMQSFYTAIELCEFIEKNFGVRFSRSIISRHLGQLGYSYKNSKSSPIQKMDPMFCQIRRKYCDIAHQILNQPNKFVIYVDELVLSPSAFNSRIQSNNQNAQNSECFNSMIVAISSQHVVHFGLKEKGFYNREDFSLFLQQTFNIVKQTIFKGRVPPKKSLVLVTDTHSIHYDPFDAQQDDKIVQKVKQKYGVQRLYLPPASSHLNPVDSLFNHIRNKIKHVKTPLDTSSLKDLMIKLIHEQQTGQKMDVYVKDTLRAVANGRTSVLKKQQEQMQESELQSFSYTNSLSSSQSPNSSPAID